MSGIRIWSHNIQGWQNEGDYPWRERAETYYNVLQHQDPHIVCLQEYSHPLNFDDIHPSLFDHSRMLGNEIGDGVFNPIFWNLNHFNYVDSGSEYLNRYGDKKQIGWDAENERGFTWVVLDDHVNDMQLLCINTHLDHIGENARQQGIAQILSFVQEFPEDTQIILTADFNCSVYKPIRQTYYTSSVFELLTTAGFIDAFRALHGVWPPPFTYHNFEGDDYTVGEYGTYYVDSIHLRNLRVESASLIKHKRGEIPLSDHYPLIMRITDPSRPDKFNIYV